MTGLSSWAWGENVWIGVSALASLTVIISSFADRKRARRRHIDRVGFMPWTLITVMSVLVAVISAALAIKTA